MFVYTSVCICHKKNTQLLCVATYNSAKLLTVNHNEGGMIKLYVLF